MADMVKSVEFVEVNTTGEKISYNLTKGQNYTNCVPFLSNHLGGNTDYVKTMLWDCTFSGTTESGIVGFERWDGMATEGYIKCFVVEFDPAEVYVEQGEFTLSSDDLIEVTTASGFNPTRTGMIHHWYCSDGNRFYSSRTQVRGRVTASGTLDFHRASLAANILDGHWYIFEAKNNQFIVDHGSIAGNSNGLVESIRSYDLLKTFVISSVSGGHTSDLYADRSTGYITITNRDVFEWHRVYSGGSNSNIAYQMIEFQDTNIHVPYKNNPSLSSTVHTYTWDEEGRTSVPVDLDYSMVINTGGAFDYINATSQTTYIDGLSSSVKFTGVSGIEIQKASYNTSVTIPSIFVVDWKGYAIDSGTNPSPIDPTLSFVKSVQNETIVTTAKTNFVALSKGQIGENCVLFGSQHATTNANNPYNYMHDIYISDTNTVVANRPGTSSDGVVEVSVVEFYPDQVRVQSGVLGGGTGFNPEIEISLEHTIDPSKSFLLAKWSSRTSTNNWSWHNVRHRIIDENTLGFYGYQSTANYNHLTWFLAEDITEDNSCFQVFSWLQQDGSNVGRGISGDMNFPYHNTFLIASMATTFDGNEYIDRSCSRSYYYAPNQPQMIVSANSSNSRYFSGQAVKITRNGQVHTIGSTPEITTLIDTIDMLPTSWSGIEDITVYNNTSLSYAQQNTTTQDATGAIFCSAKITDYNDSLVTVSRGQSGYTTYPSFAAICWPGADYVSTPANIPTRSLVQSVAKYTLDVGKRIYSWVLDKGQTGSQCVPFATWNVNGNATTDDCLKYFEFNKGYSGQQYLSMTRGSTTGSDDITHIYVLEFSPEQVKVQSGTYGIVSADFTITIEEVDLTKAFLVFYSFAEGNQNWSSQNVSGKFENSTTLRFRRIANGGTLFVSWFVVECLGNQWDVQHLYTDSAGNLADTYQTLEYAVGSGKRWIFCSLASNYDSTSYTDRSAVRVISRTDNLIQINRTTAGASLYYLNTEIVRFNYNLDITVLWEDPSMAATTNTYSDVLKTLPVIEEKRTIVFNPAANNSNRTNATTHSYGNAESRMLYELIDFDISDPKLRVSKYNTLSTYGCACMTEVPEFNKYYMEGYTKERGNPVPREVRAYRSSTGELVDTTMSVSGTGYFFVETKYSDEHYVICLDDEATPDYNNLIYSRIYPTVISGTFAYDEGLVTTSGLPIGVPLGRL